MVDGHCEQATKEKANPADLTPWKVLGRKWHLMKKGLPKRPAWDFAALEKLLPIVEKTLADCSPDFSAKGKIGWKNASGKPVADLHTKRKDNVELVVFVPHDSVTVGTVAEFGVEQEIKPAKSGQDSVRLAFNSADQVNAKLKSWLKDACE